MPAVKNNTMKMPHNIVSTAYKIFVFMLQYMEYFDQKQISISLIV